MKFLIPKPRNSDLDILGHPRNLSDNNNATILNFNSYRTNIQKKNAYQFFNLHVKTNLAACNTNGI